MNIFKTIFSIFSNKSEATQKDFEEDLHSVVIEEYADFNDITQDFMDYIKSQYEIEFNDITADGFYAKTDVTGEPSFIKKYTLESGENLWFMMIYEPTDMEVISLHLFGGSGSHSDVYDESYVSNWKNVYRQREELELSLSKKIADKANIIKV